MSTTNSGDLFLNAITNAEWGALLFRTANTGTEDWGLTPNGTDSGRNLLLRYNASTPLATFNPDLSATFSGKISSNYTASPSDGGTVVPNLQAVKNVLNYVTPEMYGAKGDGSTDDRAAFVAMLSAIASGSRKTALLSSTIGYRITGAGQITVPGNVSLASLCDYAGTDGNNLPLVYFADGGGFFAEQGVSFSGLRLLTGNADSTVPLIEAKGQIGLFSMRLDSAQYGLRASRRVVLNYSNVQANPQVSVTSGLQNGTYTGVPFTARSNTGTVSSGNATLKVIVQNGQIATVNNVYQVFFDSVGTGCDLPNFMVDLAPGALYPGSPAIRNAGQAFLSPMGRSRLHEVWCVNVSKQAIEIDGALDFCHVNNVHCWISTGKIVPGSTAFRIGHIDGLGMIGCKVFCYDNPCLWDKPPNGSNSFASVIGLEIDYSNVGHIIRGPMKLDLTGGYDQCIGKCVSIASPLAIVKISKNLLCQADHHVSASDFQLLVVEGCTFERGDQNPGLFNVNAQNSTGKGIFCVGDNTADGNSPFLFAAGNVEGAVGTNAWRRKYPAADGSGNVYNGYTNVSSVSDGSKVQILPLRRFQFSAVTDSNGRIAIPHQMGSPGPNACSVEMNGAAANAGWSCAVVSVDATNVTVGNFLGNGSPLGAGATVTMYVML